VVRVGYRVYYGPVVARDPFPNFPVALPSWAFAYQINLRTTYTQHWNVNVQQEIGRNRVLELACRSKGCQTPQRAQYR
jgi:hypothetical protein